MKFEYSFENECLLFLWYKTYLCSKHEIVYLCDLLEMFENTFSNFKNLLNHMYVLLYKRMHGEI